MQFALMNGFRNAKMPVIYYEAGYYFDIPFTLNITLV